ncbi:MAG: 50S ribosomal protein L1 [Candidatus Gracilibacteria bacterium]|nr:50S ribosomal protein L1 [Candidatus Gracilibacteria bacterium]MDD2908377.1 50S ribosomal protein L1 [Candidatus Gracilibacteria bacterium]
MQKRGKKYNQAVTLVEKDKIYTLDEACELLERTNTVKFDPTVEIHFNLNIDPKHSDQMVRSTITLPNGSGKTVKIGAFDDSGNDKELIAAGATVAGGDDLLESVAQGKIEFDIAIATPAMMRKMGKVAKILGPKGIMPNPKSGTVGDNLIAIIKELAAGKFEFKNDKQGNVHSIAGKLSFGTTKIKENIEYFIKTIKEVKPTGVKSTYINTIYICTSMSPSIRLDIK